MERRLSELVSRPGRGRRPGEQLERGLAVLVREGALPPGRRLPSTRRLASRLGIHRNTVAAAHRRLAERGLLTVRHGARARVPRYDGGRSAGEPGPSPAEGAGSDGDREGGRPRSVVAASADAATARLMAAELSAALRSAAPAARVRARRWPGPTARGDGAVRPDEGSPGTLSGRGDRPLVVSLPGRAAAGLLASGTAPRLLARLGRRRGAARALRRVTTLAVVALLTDSRVLREAVRADADRLRPGEVTLLPLGTRPAADARSAARRADLVIADALAAAALWASRSPPAGPRPVPLRLLAGGTLERVARRLGGRAGARATPRPTRRVRGGEEHP